MNTFSKTLAAAATALTMAMAFAPTAAEAFPRGGHGIRHHGGHLGGWHHGGWRHGGWRHGGHRYGYIARVGYGGECYSVRQRVWNEYRGRFVMTRRTVCN